MKRKRTVTGMRHELYGDQQAEHPVYLRVEGYGNLLLRNAGDGRFIFLEQPIDGDQRSTAWSSFQAAKEALDLMVEQLTATPIVLVKNKKGFKFRGWVQQEDSIP